VAYSNLQALESLLRLPKKEGISPDNCICTGDVGYCAQPKRRFSFLKSWKARSIAGNVEIQLSENAEDCGCDFTKGSLMMIFRNCGATFGKPNYLLLLYHT
jgi:hypothetical protein